jgi:hypothetical protein
LQVNLIAECRFQATVVGDYQQGGSNRRCLFFKQVDDFVAVYIV